METMKALVYAQPGQCSIEDVPMPQCQSDEVIIKVMAASICKGADRRHHTTGHRLAQYPVTTGHEFTGYVYQIGDKITQCKVGDRVCADNSAPCGACYFCKREMYTHCENLGSIGHNLSGGFAQYVKVNERAIEHLPAHITFNEACMSEPVACCIHAMDRLNLEYGEDVLVFGAGPNGMILSQLIQHSNANSVTTLAPTQAKLDLLNEYGIATIQIDRNDPQKHMDEVLKRFPRGVDAIVEATGSASILPNCFKLLKKGGRLLQFGSTADTEEIVINPAYFYCNEIQYYTAYCQVHEFGRAVDAIASGKVKTDRLVTRTYPLEQFPQAIEDVLDHSVLKLVIRPNGMDDE